MNLRESFDRAAQRYDDARPSYPDEVIRWIVDRTGVSTDDQLLEIGAGTGQATMKFAERGYRIHCVELGENLAEVLKWKCAAYPVTVDVCPFESWAPEPSFRTSFIFSATAFHWIDLSVRYSKCHGLLDDGGYLVLLWNMAPPSENPMICQAYDLLWEHYPDRKKQEPIEEIKIKRKREVIDSGLFTLEDYLDYRWNPIQTRENFIQGFYTQSAFLSLAPDKQIAISAKVNDLFLRLSDTIETDFYTTAYIARKRRTP